MTAIFLTGLSLSLRLHFQVSSRQSSSKHVDKTWKCRRSKFGEGKPRRGSGYWCITSRKPSLSFLSLHLSVKPHRSQHFIWRLASRHDLYRRLMFYMSSAEQRNPNQLWWDTTIQMYVTLSEILKKHFFFKFKYKYFLIIKIRIKILYDMHLLAMIKLQVSIRNSVWRRATSRCPFFNYFPPTAHLVMFYSLLTGKDFDACCGLLCSPAVTFHSCKLTE